MTYMPNFIKMTQKASINDLQGQAQMQVQYLMLNFYNMNKTTSKKIGMVLYLKVVFLKRIC